MSPATTHALADLESTADALEAADLMLAAHSIRRAVRTLRAELSPAVVLDGQEDDGDPEVVGERIDPSLFVKPTSFVTLCGARSSTYSLPCGRRDGHDGPHRWVKR